MKARKGSVEKSTVSSSPYPSSIPEQHVVPVFRMQRQAAACTNAPVFIGFVAEHLLVGLPDTPSVHEERARDEVVNGVAVLPRS